MRRLALYVSILALGISFAAPVFALGLSNATGFANEAATVAQIDTRQSVENIVADIIQIVLGLVGIIFMLLCLYGGFTWMTSSGDPEKIKKAKGLILNGAIGMLIILTAYSITYFIARQIESAIP